MTVIYLLLNAAHFCAITGNSSIISAVSEPGNDTAHLASFTSQPHIPRNVSDHLLLHFPIVNETPEQREHLAQESLKQCKQRFFTFIFRRDTALTCRDSAERPVMLVIQLFMYNLLCRFYYE